MAYQRVAPPPTVTDFMNANEDRDLKNTQAKQTIDANDLKMEVARLDQLHQIASSATDQASYDRARATVGKMLGPEILVDIPEQYDPAMIEQFKTQALSVKDRIELEINKMKAQNPFGNSLEGKLAAAEASGDVATATTLRNAITAAAQARGTGQMLDYGGNVIPNKVYPNQQPTGGGVQPIGNAVPTRKPTLSTMMGGGAQPASVQPANVMTQPNDGTTFNQPMNPKQRQTQFETNEAIRKEGGLIKAKTQAQAEIDLPGIENTAIQLDDVIERIVNHPGLRVQTGLIADIPAMPGGDGASFMALYDQAKGQQFMEAFKTLKGGGQITEKEGEKATDALAAMQRAQKTEDFIKNARIFQSEIKNLTEIARNRAKGNFTPARRLGDKIPASGNDGVVDYRDWMK